MSILDASLLKAPMLRFDPAIPSRVHPQAYRGLQLFGPYDASALNLPDKSILFVFPEELRVPARKLAMSLLRGNQNFPGFDEMFRVPLANNHIEQLPIVGDYSSPTAAAKSYREEIARWNIQPRTSDPQLAMVLVPHSERWETERPYYEAKAAFARLGIPTQMVTAELLESDREFTWSIANIALAAFVKLGGVPWVVDAPRDDHDLVIGIGRADVRRYDGVQRIFGYALSFASNGMYQHSWSFTPTADEDSYQTRLEEVITQALSAARDPDETFRRIVIHLGKRTGRAEIRAVQQAMSAAGVTFPTALVRLDETILYDIANGNVDTLAPPKGLAIRLGSHRVLLQSEGVSSAGVPSGPLLVELNDRSDVGPDDLDDLVAQAFRLSHANWRAFNARSQPVTLIYGELLARLVGYLEEVATWEPTLLRSDLRDRPWFL